MTIPRIHGYNVGPRMGMHAALAPKAVLHLQFRTFSAFSTSGCWHFERGNRNKNKCGYDDGPEVNDLMVQILVFLQWTLTYLRFLFALSSLELC